MNKLQQILEEINWEAFGMARPPFTPSWGDDARVAIGILIGGEKAGSEEAKAALRRLAEAALDRMRQGGIGPDLEAYVRLFHHPERARALQETLWPLLGEKRIFLLDSTLLFLLRAIAAYKPVEEGDLGFWLLAAKLPPADPSGLGSVLRPVLEARPEWALPIAEAMAEAGVVPFHLPWLPENLPPAHRPALAALHPHHAHLLLSAGALPEEAFWREVFPQVGEAWKRALRERFSFFYEKENPHPVLWEALYRLLRSEPLQALHPHLFHGLAQAKKVAPKRAQELAQAALEALASLSQEEMARLVDSPLALSHLTRGVRHLGLERDLWGLPALRKATQALLRKRLPRNERLPLLTAIPEEVALEWSRDPKGEVRLLALHLLNLPSWRVREMAQSDPHREVRRRALSVFGMLPA